MHATRLLQEIRQLPASDRLDLLNQIWAELSAAESVSPLSPEQRKLLDQRLEQHLANPDQTMDWDQARDQILDQL